MSNENRTLFNESWHRVSGQRLRLRPSVTLRRQRFRGENWFVARDGFTNTFFRFRPEAYDFIARLDGRKTVEEIWMGCLERSPKNAPGQGEVVSMLAQLYQANLLAADTTADTHRLFERHQKRRKQQVMSQVFGIFFLRIRLFDPDPLLNRTWPFLRWLASKTAAIGWFLWLGLGLSVVASNWDRALDQSQAVLAPGNLLLLYGAFTLAKLIHEFGHAFAVKAFGGEVHAMGITLLVFTPIPYVDATAAWAFRERWKRVVVGLGGMIPELAFASGAALVWAATGPGTLNSLAYNVMIVASVSTLLFNLNPLLRFDGYYILSDLTESPNLQMRSARQWLHNFESRALDVKTLESPASTRKEAVWLSVFGVASWCYRMFITVAIILLVADRYFGLGLLAGVLTFIGAFVMPAVKASRYLVREPRIERARNRAWAWALGGLAVVIGFLGLVPMPNHFRAVGIVRAEGSSDVFTQVPGWVTQVPSAPGATVATATPLVVMENAELDLAIAAAEAELVEARGRERQMLAGLAAGIEPSRVRREAAAERVDALEEDRAGLTVRAQSSGRWVAQGLDDWNGTWLPRGVRLGEVVGAGPDWEFFAVVRQDNASELFGAANDRAEVRFKGTAGQDIVVDAWRVVPGRQTLLPSASLGWLGGGPIEVRNDDGRGLEATEPFFLVVGRIAAEDGVDPDTGRSPLWQGRAGVMRFDLPWSPLLVQWARDFRQLLQNRYQI
ncbi:M50 family metallopeptidase [Actomonas aquatica]|uniref:M50 family metallopeptidase n=1 Tax=Actomonas aquatica TaxID=2866162 RepID=A0ABZ1C3A8_9BACT|nr:M50 family metallopeptidase [Opitutus sp. WL0086]WRQ86187.1 M50 family metallopeptidase [Opitutus sp. WL0086]